MQQENGKIPPPPGKVATILIVDDQPENLDLLVRILKQGGYNTRPALNGQLALGAVAHIRPDLIILDIRMPEMDGFEICDRLKADPHARDIPVIFISALDEADEKVRAFQAGAVDYIARPFQHQEVLARVSTHLELARMRSRMEALIQSHATAMDAKSRELAHEITTHQDTAQQLRQSERDLHKLAARQKDLAAELKATKSLIGHIAHEFHNVLGRIINNSEIMRNEAKDAPLNQQCLDEINQASLRGQEVIKKLMALGRKGAVEPVAMNPGQPAKDTSKQLKTATPKR